MGMVTVTTRNEQLELRPFMLADTEDYYDLVRDPSIAASAGFTPAHSLVEAEFLLKQQAKLPQIFAIELTAIHRVIGSVGLYERMTNTGEPATLEMDLGYMLNARYWGRGIMTAAVARILRYGFETLHLRRITASCLANNPASKRILEHANFRQYDAVRHPYYAPFGAGQTELFFDCVELNL